jgi:hypothetical protein
MDAIHPLFIFRSIKKIHPSCLYSCSCLERFFGQWAEGNLDHQIGINNILSQLIIFNYKFEKLYLICNEEGHHLISYFKRYRSKPSFQLLIFGSPLIGDFLINLDWLNYVPSNANHPTCFQLTSICCYCYLATGVHLDLLNAQNCLSIMWSKYTLGKLRLKKSFHVAGFFHCKLKFPWMIKLL